MSNAEVNLKVIKRLFSESEWLHLSQNEQFVSSLAGMDTPHDTVRILRAGLDLLEQVKAQVVRRRNASS